MRPSYSKSGSTYLTDRTGQNGRTSVSGMLFDAWRLEKRLWYLGTLAEAANEWTFLWSRVKTRRIPGTSSVRSDQEEILSAVNRMDAAWSQSRLPSLAHFGQLHLVSNLS